MIIKDFKVWAQQDCSVGKGAKPEDPEFDPLEPTRWEERTGSLRLTSDLRMH